MNIGKPFRENWRLTQKFANPPFNAAIAALYKKVGLVGHNGQDYGCPSGTTIIACDDGTVQVGFEAGGYGNYVKIIHSWGESVYAHLQQAVVVSGTPIKRGQAIGFSDSTGASTAPHLHFGIRINPYNKKDGYLGYSDPEPHFGEPSQGGGVNMPQVLVRDVIKAIYRKMIGREIPSSDLTNEEAKQPFSVEDTIGRFMSPDFYAKYDLHTSAELKEQYDKGYEKGKTEANSGGTPIPPDIPGGDGDPWGNDSPSGLLTALDIFLRDYYKGSK